MATPDISTLKISESAESQALGSQFVTLSKQLPESLPAFNKQLTNNTFLLGNTLTDVDSQVFKAIHAHFSKGFAPEDYKKFRHVIRWVDFLQNHLNVSDKISVDYNVELAREVKEKKKKEEKKEQPPQASAKEAGKEKDAAKDDKPKFKGKPDEETLKKLREEAKAKKEAKKAKAAADQSKQAAQVTPPNPSMIDLRVGFIEKAIKHPDADSLYVSTIHCGDESGEPRTVCSGLVKHFPLEAMQKRYVVLVCNLKPVNMRGIKSSAMVLCASNEDTVEFVTPPAGSKPGEKVFFEGFNGTPEKQLNPKKKIWETVQPGFSTNEALEVIFKQEGKPDAKLVNERGEIFTVGSLVGAQVR